MSASGSFTGALKGGRATLRLPLSAGGCTCSGNIALAHRRCNSERGSLPIGEAVVGRRHKRRKGHLLMEHKP